LALARNPLLNEAASEVGVDKAALGTLCGIAKRPIADAFSAREAPERRWSP